MTNYVFYSRTEVIVTDSPLDRLRERVEGRRVGIVSTKTVLGLPECTSILNCVAGVAAENALLGVARPDPTVEDADVIARLAKEREVDLIIAIGGGSAIDTAKAVRASVATRRSVPELFADGSSAESSGGPSLMVIPSAFGTGAETSAGAILTRLSDGKKGGIRGRSISPDVAIITTALAMRLSAAKQVEIGFDALAHAIETYLSRASSPVTDLLALDVLERAPSLLIRIADGDSSATSIGELARCSFQMGINLANASTCLPHRMQYAVASLATAGHQLDLVALYPAWIRALEAAGVARLDTAMHGIARAMRRDDLSQGRTKHSDAITDFFNRLRLSATLRGLGLTKGDASRLAERTAGNVALDPLDPSRLTIERIFEDALASPAA